MEQIRLGIIGAGAIVEKKHLPALAETREIAVLAVCRRNAEQLHQLADRFRIPDRYTDYRALLDDGRLDAVLIAAGPPAQTRIVADVAAAGKHILVEKPLAESSVEARTMVQAVTAANVHFQVGFNKRFYYGYRQAKRVIEQGELGTLSGIHARFWFPAGRRDGLLHNGIHFFDLARFFGGPVITAFARRCAPTDNAAAETVAVTLGFQSGAVGSLLLSSLGSWNYPNERIDIVGSNGTALAIENGRDLRVFSRDEGRPSAHYENTLSVHWWSGHDEQGFIPQFQAFAQRIRDGVAPSEVGHAAGGRDGVASLQVMEAVRHSLAAGVPVAVAPVDA